MDASKPANPFLKDPMLLSEMPVEEAVQVAGLIELYAEEAREEAEGAIRALLPKLIGKSEEQYREAVQRVYRDVRHRYARRVAELFA
jgi:hypothetical protein